MSTTTLSTLGLDDLAYPARLRALTKPPKELVVEGAPLEAACAVAVVGTRAPTPEAAWFAFELAGSLARAGAVVISGGALGIDGAAHRGALAAGGRTWAVAATGRGHCFPTEHEELFREIAAGPGAMVWPFADDVRAKPANFLRRNGVLVALADAVVIVQAGAPSGTLNAVSWAQRQGRMVWAVPGPPWDPKFVGCRAAIDGGARVVTSVAGLLRGLGLPGQQLSLSLPLSVSRLPSTPPPPRPPPLIADPVSRELWEACTEEPRHIDEIAADARVCVSSALTRLLTLALENVLVEGPEGFYRRGIQL